MGASKRIAFLGMGLMGRPMAVRLIQAGHHVVVWNRTALKTQGMEELGAGLASSPAGAVRQAGGAAELVITMLEAGEVVQQVLHAALPELNPGSLVMDMSSTQPSEARSFHALLAAHGVAFVDAPVSGGVLGAQAGTLAIMVGASAPDFARVEPVLRALGQPTHVGAPGCGQLAKLCNQLIVGGTLNIVAEALMLAQAGGADPAAVRQALRGGFAESRILEVHGQRMLDRNFIPGGQIKSQAKDMDNVMAAAALAGLQLPLATLVTEAYRDLLAVLPNADQSAALLGLERRNPGIRLGDAPDQLP